MKYALYALLIAFALINVPAAQAAEYEFDKAHTQIKFKVQHLMVANVWGVHRVQRQNQLRSCAP